MTKDFDLWNRVKKITDEKDVSIKIREGEVRWCKFGLNIGKEIIGKGENFRRPVLILKKYSGDVFLGLPLTTQYHEGDWYYELEHKGESRIVILNQGRIMDKKRLAQKMFEISEYELRLIKIAYCDLILKK